MQFKNYMEGVVNEQLSRLLDKADVCHCDRCRIDIMAYALNRLPPKYVVTHWGHIYAEIDEFKAQFKADVIVALEQAIKKVSSNPRHDAHLSRQGGK